MRRPFYDFLNILPVSMLSRVQTTRNWRRPEGLRRLHINIIPVDTNQPSGSMSEQMNSEFEPYDRRRFAVLGESERWNRFWLTNWYPPQFDLLTPEEWAEDWRQVASFDIGSAIEALDRATPEQRSLLHPVDLSPLFASDVPHRSRLQALRLLARVLPATVQDEPTGCSVSFAPAMRGFR